MGSVRIYYILVLALAISISPSYSEKLHSSEAETLVKIREILNFPAFLSSWNGKTDFCNTEPTPSITLVCYGSSVSQLHIIGKGGTPQNISVESLMTALAELPGLKVLTLVSLGLQGSLPDKIGQLSSLEILNISMNYFKGKIPLEISKLVNLQTLILDENKFEGQIPDVLGSLPTLLVLSLRNNSLEGPLPKSLSLLEGLRVLALSKNQLSGQVPDLSALANLQELDLDDNSFGPQFPQIGTKVVTLVLSRNKFMSGIPDEISLCYQLQRLDISFNKFMGPFPTSLLSLPSIAYLNVEGNKLTGVLVGNLPCNGELKFVDLSHNRLTGVLPSCLESDSSKRVVLYAGNCLETKGQSQNPHASCQNEALAAGFLPLRKRQRRAKVILVIVITLGVLGGVFLIGLTLWLVMRARVGKIIKIRSPAMAAKNASGQCPSKQLSDARYVSQTMKIGALGVPPYRTFSLEELEEATNNFDTSAFMGEGSHGQMYRGRLKDGSFVAIRCLKLRESHDSQYFMHHIKLMSKLRHKHLVSAVGYCFEYYLDDSTVSRLFLVFEYVPNGTLRHWVSGNARHRFTWSQRIAAIVGVARGIQFLHKGIVPGIFSNNLKITDVLVDHNFNAKISSYNLPLLAENSAEEDDASTSAPKADRPRAKQEEKSDIYDFGVILLETIMGRPIKTRSDLNSFRNQVQAGVMAEEASRRGIVAAEVESTCSDQSLKTAMEISVRCLARDPNERPPIEDILWNLQFAAQVQEAWQSGDFQGEKGSPDAPPHHLPRLRLTYQ